MWFEVWRCLIRSGSCLGGFRSEFHFILSGGQNLQTYDNERERERERDAKTKLI